MSTSVKEFAVWLLSATEHHISLRDLTNTLVHKLREAGLPLSRVNLGVFALHPEMAGYAVSWAEGMEAPLEFPVTREDMLTPTYLHSPIRVLVEGHATVVEHLLHQLVHAPRAGPRAVQVDVSLDGLPRTRHGAAGAEQHRADAHHVFMFSRGRDTCNF